MVTEIVTEIIEIVTEIVTKSLDPHAELRSIDELSQDITIYI